MRLDPEVDRRTSPRHDGWGPLIIIVAIVIARGLWELATKIFDQFILPNVSLIGLQILLAIGTVAVSLVLYFVRCRARGFYGVFECVVGIFGAIAVAGQIFPGLPGSSRVLSVFSWVGCLYIIVRGLDNSYEALKSNAQRNGNNPFYVWWEKTAFGRSAQVSKPTTT